MTATVSTPVFEGPVELLLQLVNNHQVDVYDIALADLVDAFVAEVASWETIDLPTLSEFLMVAAVLLELKSRRLLPGPDDIESDEELVGWEERDLLLARLLECQAYAAAADKFTLLIEQAARSAPRHVGLDDGFVVKAPDLLQGITPDMLADAYRRATAAQPNPALDLHHVTVDAVSVSEAVSELETHLPLAGKTTFRGLTCHFATRIEVIVRFLALLELCKQGRVSLDQGHAFGDLVVEWMGDSVPVLTGADYDEYEG
ncbi:MAG: segregation and condensation protein A [Acidimicrobiales bacterium]